MGVEFLKRGNTRDLFGKYLSICDAVSMKWRGIFIHIYFPGHSRIEKVNNVAKRKKIRGDVKINFELIIKIHTCKPIFNIQPLKTFSMKNLLILAVTSVSRPDRINRLKNPELIFATVTEYPNFLKYHIN